MNGSLTHCTYSSVHNVGGGPKLQHSDPDQDFEQPQICLALVFLILSKIQIMVCILKTPPKIKVLVSGDFGLGPPVAQNGENS